LDETFLAGAAGAPLAVTGLAPFAGGATLVLAATGFAGGLDFFAGAGFLAGLGAGFLALALDLEADFFLTFVDAMRPHHLLSVLPGFRVSNSKTMLYIRISRKPEG
jgi:hypothetical protein